MRSEKQLHRYCVSKIHHWFGAWHGIRVLSISDMYVAPKANLISWVVYNRKTGKMVGETFKTKNRAYEFKNKLERKCQKRTQHLKKFVRKSRTYNTKSPKFQVKRTK